MTTQNLLLLPTTKKTIEILRENAIDKVWCQDVIKSFNMYFSLPNNVKQFATKPTVQSVYNSLKEAKANGYRKELVL